MIRSLALVAYRAALWFLLPERFRCEHGREMEVLFDEALQSAGRRGHLLWLFAVVRGLWDVAEAGLRMRSGPADGDARRSLLFTEVTMESILQDARFALRSLIKAPGFTLVAVLTLALGIGANTAIFSLVNAVLLRAPAHVLNPEELVSIYTSDFSGPQFGMNSRPDFEDYRAQSSAIYDAVAIAPGIVNVAGDDGISQIFVTEFVSGNYFEVLGVRPALGRAFTSEESDYTSGLAVAVLSHGLWTRMFGADPGVIGSTFRASGQTVTVVGVAPEGFSGSVPLVTPELWMPDATSALIQGAGSIENRGNRGWMIRARLADDASADLAQQQLTALAPRLQEETPGSWTDVNGDTRRITVAADEALPPNMMGVANGFAIALLSVVGIVLLIACANVANLTLARSSQRGREMAIRVAMGAGRGRVIRQLLTESALIGTVGGLMGALLAVYVVRFAEAFRPVTGVAVTLDLGVDRTVLVFSALVTVLTVLAVGLLPALKASRPDLVPQLKEGGRGGGGPFRWHEMRHLLVISQVSASLLLLVGAGLFLKSLRAAVNVDPGFTVEGAATITLNLGPEGYTVEDALDFFGRLEQRVSTFPGVESVSTADVLPMTILAGRRRGVSVPGYEPSDGEDMEFQFHSVGPRFMAAMEMEMVRGREFTAEDREGGLYTVMVNETFAEHFWPNEDPVGKLVSWNGQDDAQVVGLVADAMYRSLRDTDRPAFFVPLAQNPSTALTLLARTGAGRARDLLPAMRAEVAAIDPSLPIASLQTMEEAVAFTLLIQRIAGWLLSIAGALGLLLATVGLYGVMSFLVAQRTREVGVRIALGAEAGHVIRMMVGRGLLLASLGSLLGLGVAAGLTRFAGTLLFGVNPLDIGVFAAMGAAALGVAAFASWVPARRAAHIDPMEALRHE